MARAAGTEEELPEPDRFGSFPHPREMTRLFGQDEAETTLLEAYRSGRMHHGWLIHGEEGIGKAGLAYRFAKFILANPDPSAPAVRQATSLDVHHDSAAARLVVSRAHPDLMVLRRAVNPRTKAAQTIISVDLVREALHFFSMTAGSGGWRVLIVDTADDLNISAANAILKTLEEPPARALVLLVSNQPGRLLPTIRSRCRRLRLQPLDTDALNRAIDQAGAAERFTELDDAHRAHLYALASGSVRHALALLDEGLLELHREVAVLLAGHGPMDNARVHALANQAARPGKPELADRLVGVIELELAARTRSLTQDRAGRELAKLAEVWEKTRTLADQTEVFHFDRKQMILNIFRWIEAASR